MVLDYIWHPSKHLEYACVNFIDPFKLIVDPKTILDSTILEICDSTLLSLYIGDCGTINLDVL